MGCTVPARNGHDLLIALTGTAPGFALGLLVAIIRTIALPEKEENRPRTSA